jgi:adhesin transport system membrane fusion protein
VSETHLEDLADRIKPRTASNVLLWGVVAFVVAFFVWASLTELDRTVRGMGKVIPSSQLQIVSNLEGGIVSEILVRGGQQVRAGQELVRLDRTASGAEFGSGEATAGALIVKIARLQAEIEGRAPAYPNATSPAIADQIRIEQALHASRMADVGGAVAAAEARLTQARRAIAEADAAYAARVTTRNARQQEARIIRPLVERGIEPTMSLIEAESGASVAASEVEQAAAAQSRARAAAAEAASMLARTRQEWLSQTANELASAQAELSARSRQLPALADRMRRTVVRAPVSGRINRVLVTTRGSAVQATQPLVELVPSDESLMIEAQIRPEDIGFVRMNQSARIAITAYDRSIYGVLEGRVVNISPDATLNERTGETFYTVRVRTQSNALRDPDNRPMQIGVGMVAEVDLLGDRRTVLQYILTPIARLTERMGTEK